MINWYETQVEKEIAQERYRVITVPELKELKSRNLSPPRKLPWLTWTGRMIGALRCRLLHFAGETCA